MLFRCELYGPSLVAFQPSDSSGATEPGETIEETAYREAREEVGIGLAGLRLVGVFSEPEYLEVYPNGDQVFPVGLVYAAASVGIPAPNPAEVVEIGFFDPDDLPDDLAPTSLRVLDRYRAGSLRLTTPSL